MNKNNRKKKWISHWNWPNWDNWNVNSWMAANPFQWLCTYKHVNIDFIFCLKTFPSWIFIRLLVADPRRRPGATSLAALYSISPSKKQHQRWKTSSAIAIQLLFISKSKTLNLIFFFQFFRCFFLFNFKSKS